MWTLLKAEISYNRHLLIQFYSLTVLFMIAAIITRFATILEFSAFTMVIYIILAISTAVRMDEGKRDRVQAMLPVTPMQRGLFRVIIFICLQALMVIQWVILLLLQPESRSEAPLAELMALSAINLIITFLFVIHDDLKYYGGWRSRLIMYLLVLSGLVFSIIFRFYPWVFSPGGPKKTLAEGAVFNLVWLGLAIISVVIFTKKNSYKD